MANKLNNYFEVKRENFSYTQ